MTGTGPQASTPQRARFATELASALRIARRELRGGLAAFRVFLFCLMLGVAAIAAVGVVRAAIQEGLTREGASLLGGDAELTFTYRVATGPERDWLEANAQRHSEVVEFRSMAVTGAGDGAERALTQVKAVDGAYPLVGQVELSPPMPLAQALAGRNGLPGAVVQPLLADRLGLQPGDRFRLGTQEFLLTALLERAPDGATDGFALGPRTLVATPDLDGSGLLGPGTLYSTHYRMLLPPDAELERVKAEALARFADQGARWRDARRGAPGIQRFVDRLGTFLVLVGLAGLAVGGVGVSAAVRAYLATRRGTIAVLKTLGASRRVILMAYGAQIGVLSALGIGAGLLLGLVLPNIALPLLAARLPVPAVPGLHPAPLLQAALYGALTAAVFTLWPLASTDQIRPAALFREAFTRIRAFPRPAFILVTAVLLALLVGAAALFAGSARLALAAAVGIAGALVALALAALALRWLARRLARLRAFRGRPSLRLALASIGGPGQEAMSVVLALGLGLSVMATVGQIDSNLRQTIAGDLPEVAPSYFFVDIQQDQIDEFRDRLAANPGVTRVEAAPMLRGVITRINDRPAEEFGNHWVLRGDRGLTYAATQPKGTRLTAGTWWPEDYAGPPQISFAAEEAEEIGLTLGDTITINILGRDITATITSLREVDFSNAGIGFVMAMNPAALAGAPHSFISTVYGDAEAEAAILRELSTAFPNITAIRVRDAIDTAARLMEGLAAAIAAGAGVTLLTGFAVLIGAAAAGEGARSFEAAVLKTLGASRVLVLGSFALRSVLLGAAAGAVAIAAGGASAWWVLERLMGLNYDFMALPALAVVGGGIAVTLLSSLFFSLRSISRRPARVLRGRE
ncbi:drug:proton antiporter [Brevirhabdus pacifica]|uniref:Drug:proton antiporter n=2 Tax=Brevirhabdus pacifica TaxID=1267768 RepID=A0A1U7DKE7_9RHOB|nr:FtsX-like permease family protein [Brevirhabdus pacifica]APX90348.1 drug:proton antiporter [Brevirhabdus pacifica]PJJ80801.1 putative ABC transport system permease protein [Brevirhabdus pacifica]